MASPELHGPPDEPLVPLPYALYCLDGGMWGLIQGGNPRIVPPIQWAKLKPEVEVCISSLADKGPDSGDAQAKRDQLYAAILRLCQEFGYTNDHTYECAQRVVDSVSFDPWET